MLSTDANHVSNVPAVALKKVHGALISKNVFNAALLNQ